MEDLFVSATTQQLLVNKSREGSRNRIESRPHTTKMLPLFKRRSKFDIYGLFVHLLLFFFFFQSSIFFWCAAGSSPRCDYQKCYQCFINALRWQGVGLNSTSTSFTLTFRQSVWMLFSFFFLFALFFRPSRCTRVQRAPLFSMPRP